jgi:hypothetical protein
MRARIGEALQKVIAQQNGEPISLERIILKFDKMRASSNVFKAVKTCFDDLSGEGGLTPDGLVQAMNKLHGTIVPVLP